MNISEGGTRRWRSQGIGNVTRSKEYRKERSAEDIIGSVLGTLRVKCLCYFNIQVSRKRPISLESKSVKRCSNSLVIREMQIKTMREDTHMSDWQKAAI